MRREGREKGGGFGSVYERIKQCDLYFDCLLFYVIALWVERKEKRFLEDLIVNIGE